MYAGWFMSKLRRFGCVLLVLASACAFGQQTPTWQAYRPNQEVRVPRLPVLMARSHDPSDVLLTSLDVVFHDRSICCGKDSALEDRALTADPVSLREIAAKIAGKQLLSDGRPVQITADMLPAAPGIDISPSIVRALRSNHPLLMVWNSHLYVLYGAVFDEVVDSDDGSSAFMIHKLFLLDVRYSGPRQEMIFNRNTDDWAKVDGLLMLGVAAE